MAGVPLGVFHDNTNMGATRLCVLLVALVSVKMMAAQPTFGTKIWCDMFCDDEDYDDDDDSSSSSSLEDMLDSFFNPCAGCETKKPAKKKTTTTTVAPGMQQPFNIMIPPSNGMNLTMVNTGMSWLMNFMPWPAQPAKATTAAAATTAAPGTTKADGTTAAAGGTTAEATTAKA